MLAAGLVLGVVWLRQPRIELNLISIGLLAFLGLTVLSLPVALYHDTTFFDWFLRGFAPLAFLAIYFLAPRDATFVQTALLISVAAWTALVVLELAPQYAVLPFDRWTFHSRALVIPYNLVGIALLLFSRRVPPWVRFWLLSVVLVLTVGGLFRSHLALAIGMLIGFIPFVFAAKPERRHIFAVAASVLVTFVSFAAVNAASKNYDRPAESLVDTSDNRIPASVQMPVFAAADTSRWLETQYAIEQFMESPIVGKGLAYRVPSSLAFAGHEDYLAKLEATAGKKYPFVYYTHNFPAYVAMTMGLLGLIALAIFGLGVARKLISGWPWAVGPSAALISLAVFSLVGATYSLPQFGILVASLAAILSGQRPVKQ